MYIYVLLIFTIIIIIFVSFIESRITIKQSGVLPINEGDMAMMFYLLVDNSCVEDFILASAMKKCCEVFENGGNEDCTYIKLLGGHAGKIRSRTKKKVTLLYPTMYPYNRKIICDVTLYYQSDGQTGGSIPQEIIADTLINPNSPVPVTIKDFLGSRPIRTCQTIDQDPLENCMPVDCMQRYHGKKSFFHRRSKLCQPIDQCKHSSQALNMWINKCQDLNEITMPGDYEHLANGPFCIQLSFKVNDYPYVSNIRCMNGKMNKSSGFCDCHSGWGYSQKVLEVNRYSPDISPYYMCTHPETSPYFISFIITLIVVMIINSFIIWFLCW